MHPLRSSSAAAVCASLVVAACGTGTPPPAAFKALPKAAPSGGLHGFDLKGSMPSRLAIMFSMNWFGIPGSDPQGSGPDGSEWGNWRYGSTDPNACVRKNDVTACAVVPGSSAKQRVIASRRRPLAGIYSSTGRDAESVARVDLMLSHVHRSCDVREPFDVWAPQVKGLQFTSLHASSTVDRHAEMAYQALRTFYREAEKAGMNGAILPGYDGSWTFGFKTNVGLGTCDGSAGNPKSKCIDSIRADVADLARIASQHPASTLRINGKPIFLFFVNASVLDATEWKNILDGARTDSAQDFYAIGTNAGASYFEAFDAIAPWVGVDQWKATEVIGGTQTLAEHAASWVRKKHADLFAKVVDYPGRVVFGSVTPGFDDYTKHWSDPCEERQVPSPPDAPRDRALMDATFAYLANNPSQSNPVQGVLMPTWDDWTEGSEFEPDVADGTDTLVRLRQGLAQIYHEPADSAAAAVDAAIANRWATYGQARSCAKNQDGTFEPAGTPPAINLSCAPPVNQGSITGTVTNLASGGAISGATIDGGAGLSTTTDSAGHFTLSNVPAGTAAITATAAGYLARSYSVDVTANATTTQAVQLSTAGKLVGTVRSGGAGLSNAMVEAQGGQIATDAFDMTDSSGHYDEGWLPVGTYTVTCSAFGYGSQTPAPVTVTTGNTTTVDCALTDLTGTITGTVTNLSSGAPISGALVGWSDGFTESDASGHYTLPDVAGGTSIILTAAADGYLERSYDLVVTAGATTVQDVQLSTSGKLSGTVTGNGVVLANATVEAIGGQIATDQSDISDSAGHYDVGWVAVGTYAVTCSAPGFPSQTVTGATVTTGNTTTVNCALSSTVTGTVTNVKTGGAISGATVSWSGGSATSDGAGNYTLTGVTAGTVTITGAASGFLIRTYSATVTAGGTTTLNVQLSTSGKISGTVTHAGAALSGATVTATGGQISTTATDTTDSVGHYDDGWVPIGTYTVTCAKSGFTTQTVPGVTVTSGVTTTVNCAL